jgi:hypothetical protein
MANKQYSEQLVKIEMEVKNKNISGIDGQVETGYEIKYLL